MLAGPQSQPEAAENVVTTVNEDSTATAPPPPSRSPKRYLNNKGRAANPLSDVPTNDSRRNSPSTADHSRYLQTQTETNGKIADLQENNTAAKPNPGSPTAVSPRAPHSVISFWQDREKEVLSTERGTSPTKDGSPIISSRVRNSIFYQTTTTSTRAMPSSPLFSSPNVHSDSHGAEIDNVISESEDTKDNSATRPLFTEKRSSLMSSVGSIRSKKVTFEMAPPQILEFEPAQDFLVSANATPEDSDDEAFERQSIPKLTVEPSPLMKFESAFSSDVYLHRTPSGSRSLPRPPIASARNGGRPLPAVPTRPTVPPPSEPAEVEIKSRRDSEISTGSSYDPLELLDSYAFDDVNIDGEDVLDAFEAQSDSESLSTPIAETAQPLIGEQLNREMRSELYRTDSQGSETESESLEGLEGENLPVASDHVQTPVITRSQALGAQPPPELEKTTMALETSSKYAPASLPSHLRSHERTDSSGSFKLELPFETTPEPDFSVGLTDYLNSTSFLNDDWTTDRGRGPEIPEKNQTIKASSGLRARPSLTPGDVAQMAFTRRKVSGEGSQTKFLDFSEVVEELPQPHDSELLLDINSSDFSLEGITREFDKVMEIQRRGYLMRQNTKVVYARAETDFPEYSSSPEGKFQPWLGERSPRKEKNAKLVVTEKAADSLPQPSSMLLDHTAVEKPAAEQSLLYPKPSTQRPNPTKATVASQGVTPVNVEKHMSQAIEPVDASDRGRLFVKVLALKDLRLPLNDDSSFFTLTLDNGIHCVTTAYMKLSVNAPIYQEFELIVGSDLEFILTLKAKISRPTTSASRSPSPKKKENKFTLDKIFGSPKRRSVIEPVQVQHSPHAVDHLLGSDGSFGRSYIAFSQIEKEIYKKSKILEVPCFNEWATEFDATKSRKLARTPTAPYPIGKIVLQLLFYPKQHRNQEIPRSLNACLRELNNEEGETK